MEPSIFTKIINGDIPSQKVYEDDTTLVIMDLYPKQRGMVVVIPKQQIPHFEDLPLELLDQTIHTTQRVMKAQRQAYPESQKIAVAVAGTDVPNHAHLTVYPINSAEDFHAPSAKEPADIDQLKQEAERIKQYL